MINSFDIVAVFGNKVEYFFDRVERCFNIVAGVDGALNSTELELLGSVYLQFFNFRSKWKMANTISTSIYHHSFFIFIEK